jgi:hypothetical protein
MAYSGHADGMTAGVTVGLGLDVVGGGQPTIQVENQSLVLSC